MGKTEQKDIQDIQDIQEDKQDAMKLILEQMEAMTKKIESLEAEKEAMLVVDSKEEVVTPINVQDVNDSLYELVPFTAIKDADRYKDDITIGINGKHWQVKRGIQVMIPRYVMMAIEQSERQRVLTSDIIDGYTDSYENKKNSLT